MNRSAILEGHLDRSMGADVEASRACTVDDVVCPLDGARYRLDDRELLLAIYQSTPRSATAP